MKIPPIVLLALVSGEGGFQGSLKLVNKPIGRSWLSLKGINICGILTRSLPTHRVHVEVSLLKASLAALKIPQSL